MSNYNHFMGTININEYKPCISIKNVFQSFEIDIETTPVNRFSSLLNISIINVSVLSTNYFQNIVLSSLKIKKLYLKLDSYMAMYRSLFFKNPALLKIVLDNHSEKKLKIIYRISSLVGSSFQHLIIIFKPIAELFMITFSSDS